MIYRKIRTIISNFKNNVIRGMNFGETCKKIVKVQVSIIRLNDRLNTSNQNIEK